jgi:hypothetical protein
MLSQRTLFVCIVIVIAAILVDLLSRTTVESHMITVKLHWLTWLGIAALMLMRVWVGIGTVVANWRSQNPNAAIYNWLDANFTFYDVDRGADVEGRNVPGLALVSKRIWYHATDNQRDYPFSEVVMNAVQPREQE